MLEKIKIRTIILTLTLVLTSISYGQEKEIAPTKSDALLRKKPVPNELVLLCEDGDETCEGISITYFKKRHVIDQKNKIAKKEFDYDTIANAFKYTGKHTPITSMTLVNYHTKNGLDSEKLRVENGYVTGSYKASIYRKSLHQPDSVKMIAYKNGNISGDFKIINVKDSVLYQTTFKNGKGYWKDYYYKESKLREEGKVKNNYKIGRWYYYNLNGTIDSIKTYTLKDAVDVRFVYDFFNEKEPYIPRNKIELDSCN